MKTTSSPVTLISGYRGLATRFIEEFHRLGHRLSVLVRDPKAAQLMKNQYPDAFFYTGDLEDTAVAAGWVRESARHYGRIDLVINNAAITGPVGKLHETSLPEWEKTVRVNLISPLAVLHAAIAVFEKQKQGMAINLSGGGATAARPQVGAYGISKCALVRMTENLSLEYPEFLFYALSPGMLKTQMTQGLVDAGKARLGKEFDSLQEKFDQGGEDPAKAARLAAWLFENRPKELNGKLVSAIYDWPNLEKARTLDPALGYWTLRRIDEALILQLQRAFPEPIIKQ